MKKKVTIALQISAIISVVCYCRKSSEVLRSHYSTISTVQIRLLDRAGRHLSAPHLADDCLTCVVKMMIEGQIC